MITFKIRYHLYEGVLMITFKIRYHLYEGVLMITFKIRYHLYEGVLMITFKIRYHLYEGVLMITFKIRYHLYEGVLMITFKESIEIQCFLSPATPDEIKIIIKNFKNSSAGWDGINLLLSNRPSPIYLNFYATLLTYHLIKDMFLINKKNGDTSLINSYLPIFVLLVFSKVFERLIYNRLINYIMKNKILSNSQFGFRKGYSTDMAISVLTDQISKVIDNKEHVIGPLTLLIITRKLSHYGISGNILQWIHNYFSSKEQLVKFYGTKSALKNITWCPVGFNSGTFTLPYLHK